MIDKPFFFKINDNGSGPNLLLQVCHERGWRECLTKDYETNPNSIQKDNWNVWWRTTGTSITSNKALKAWQFTNHIPKARFICRKDFLTRHLKALKNTFGSIYDFSPDAYVLPVDYSKLVESCSRTPSGRSPKEGGDVWISKPVGLSQGRGISLFRKVSELVFDSSTVVQRYIQNPLLIGGYKFDLRLYVCVPSFHPLTVYVYREGLTRFSTDKFTLDDLNNKYAHLTNCSINKNGPGYMELKEMVGSGCKWSLKQLRYYLNQNGVDDWLVWQRISHIIVLTIISQINGIPPTANCFEFYGFDILIDSDLKPWLIEVNTSPALVSDCDIDPAIKKPMLHDLFDLLGLPVCNTGLSLFSELDQSSSGFDEGDSSMDEEFQMIESARTAAKVMHMANKWKLHVQYSTEKEIVEEIPEIRRPSSVSGRRLSRDFLERKPSPSPRAMSAKKRKEVLKVKWGNGRDWSRPTKVEGDWVRVFPFCSKNATKWKNPSEDRGDREVREIVATIHRYYKFVKDVSARYKKFCDEERDSVLLSAPNMFDTVWHPYR